MSSELAFTPNLAFGRLELRATDGGVEGEIPSWLVDRPEVLRALAEIARRGGTAFVKRASDNDDLVVDPSTGSCRFAEPVW